MLTAQKGLPVEDHEKIYIEKQKITMSMISHLTPIEEIVATFKELQNSGYTIGVCTNSIRRTALTALSKTNLIEYCRKSKNYTANQHNGHVCREITAHSRALKCEVSI